MRPTNNGAAPTLRQEGRSMRTSYGAWALEDAALEVMDDPPLIRPRHVTQERPASRRAPTPYAGRWKMS